MRHGRTQRGPIPDLLALSALSILTIGACQVDVGDEPAPGTGDEVPLYTCESGTEEPACVLPAGPGRLSEDGDRSLDGSQPVAGDRPDEHGWTEQRGAAPKGEEETALLAAYSAVNARSGSLSIVTDGKNGTGPVLTISEPLQSLSVEVWYLCAPREVSEDTTEEGWLPADHPPADRIDLRALDGSISLRTGGFSDYEDMPFAYAYAEPSGASGNPVAIPGAPEFRFDTWYRMRIDLDGTQATLTVSDGETTGQAELELSEPLDIDQIAIAADFLNGHGHTAYWDDFVLEW